MSTTKTSIDASAKPFQANRLRGDTAGTKYLNFDAFVRILHLDKIYICK